MVLLFFRFLLILDDDYKLIISSYSSSILLIIYVELFLYKDLDLFIYAYILLVYFYCTYDDVIFHKLLPIHPARSF